MKTRYKKEITIERDRVLVVRRRRGPVLAWCAGCGRQVEMVTADEAAVLIGASSRAIFRLVESGELHFVETPDELLLICRNSLWGHTNRTVSGGDHNDG